MWESADNGEAWLRFSGELKFLRWNDRVRFEPNEPPPGFSQEPIILAWSSLALTHHPGHRAPSLRGRHS